MNSQSPEEHASPIVASMAGILWVRAMYSKKYPEILDDPQSLPLFNKLKARYPGKEAEWEILDKYVDEFLGVNLLLRSRIFDEELKIFLSDHPNATIVNLGAGLETNFFRIDNRTLHWYELDLPFGIKLRQSLIPQGERYEYIAGDIFNLDWCDQIQWSPENGLFMFAAGLLNYFQEAQVSKLCLALAAKFPGAILMFDSGSSTANKILNRRTDKMNTGAAKHRFGLDFPQHQIRLWGSQIELEDAFPLFGKIPHSIPRNIFPRRLRILIRLSNIIKMGWYVRLRFR